MKIGIDLGGSHVAIGLVDNNHEIIEKRTYYMNDRGNGTLENYILSSIIHGINEILDNTNYRLSQIDGIRNCKSRKSKRWLYKKCCKFRNSRI